MPLRTCLCNCHRRINGVSSSMERGVQPPRSDIQILVCEGKKALKKKFSMKRFESNVETISVQGTSVPF